MKQSELEREINKYQWFHKIPLPYDREPYREKGGVVITPGIVDHCDTDIATKRFGVPERLPGKTVLDVGTFDGYFSFLAEQRGAKVTAIDSMQASSGIRRNMGTFLLAKSALQSNVNLYLKSLQEWAEFGMYHNPSPYDIVFYFGVLYHCDDPISELRALRTVTKDYALIETAIYRPSLWAGMISHDVWKFRPGYNNDDTNKWYPTIAALRKACLHVGFRDIQCIHVQPDGERATFKAYA